MEDRSHNWYDETTTKEKINDSPDKIDDIQESFKKAHPTMECPLKKEDETVEQSKTFEGTNREECSDITRVADKANGNPVKDVQELSDIKTYDFQIYTLMVFTATLSLALDFKFQQLGGKFQDRLDL
ncbi:hypothetical protein Tco_1076496 [Tanacetum coccineum]